MQASQSVLKNEEEVVFMLADALYHDVSPLDEEYPATLIIGLYVLNVHWHNRFYDFGFGLFC